VRDVRAGRLRPPAATGIWTAAAIAAGPPEVGFLSNAVPIALALYYLILPLFTQFSRGA
jgi:hypothetical protein